MSWPRIKLKRIAVTVSGGTPAVSEPGYWADDKQGHAWVAISDMSNKDVVTDTTRRVSDAGVAAARLQIAKPGTLLLSMYASLGHTAFLGTPASWNQAILGIIPSLQSDKRFLRYALASLRPNLMEFARSNTQANLNAEQVGNLELPNPPLKEQHRIADFLDAEIALIDALFAHRIRQRTALGERASAEISEALLPGALSAARGSGPWPWLPDMPTGSPLVRLGYVCRLQNGLTVDGNRNVSGDVVTRPYLRVANVQAGYVDLTTVAEVTVPRDTAVRSTLRPGDILMTEGGDLDKLGRGTVWNGELPNCLHQNHVFALRPELDRLDGDYLALMTQTVHGRCYFESTGSKTTNLASTNSSKILSFPIPLPAVSRQRVLAQNVHSKLDVIARAGRELERQLELLAERRQALITAAVTGQIDISTATGRGIKD